MVADRCSYVQTVEILDKMKEITAITSNRLISKLLKDQDGKTLHRENFFRMPIRSGTLFFLEIGFQY